MNDNQRNNRRFPFGALWTSLRPTWQLGLYLAVLLLVVAITVFAVQVRPAGDGRAFPPATVLPISSALLSPSPRPPRPTATPPPMRVIQAHPAETYVRLSWSADGKLLATGGNHETIMVWDVETLKPAHQLVHPEMVFSRFSSFSPAGRWLMASHGWHGDPLEGGVIPVYFDVAVWDLESGERVAKLTDKAIVWNVLWSPEGDVLAYWDAIPEPEVRFWAVPGSGAIAPKPLTVPGMEIGDARWLPDGTIVIAGPGENGLAIWRYTQPDYTTEIEGVLVEYAPWTTFSPDGSLVSATNHQGEIVVLDVETGEIKVELQSKEFYRLADAGLAFSPDNSQLATATEREVIVWDLATGGMFARLGGHESSVYHLAFSPDGATLAVGEADGAMRLWNLESFLTPPVTPTPLPTNTPVPTSDLEPALLLTLPAPDVDELSAAPVSQLRWLDGETLRLVTAPYVEGGTGQQRISDYDLASGEVIASQVVEVPPDLFKAVYSPDASRYASWLRGRMETGDIEGDSVAVFDAATNELVLEIPAGQIGPGNEIDWSPDGSRIAVQTFTAIEVFAVPSGDHIMTLENVIESTEGEGYMTVDWSPDGRWIASYLTGYTIGSRVAVWGAETGQLVHHLHETADSQIFYEYGSVEHIAWSPEGARLLMTRAGRAETLDVSTGEIQVKSTITLLGTGAWSSDGVYVAMEALEPDGGPVVVTIWNTETDELVTLLEREPEVDYAQPGNLVWAPGRPLLATAGIGNVVYILDAQAQHVLKLDLVSTGSVAQIAWSPSGDRLAIGGYDGIVEIWDFLE